MAALIAIFGVLVLFCGLLIYGTFSWGFVLYKFWYWFLLPVFTTLPNITFYQAVGLMLFVGLFHKNSSNAIKKEFRENKQSVDNTTNMLLPWLVLLIGLFIKTIIT